MDGLLPSDNTGNDMNQKSVTEQVKAHMAELQSAGNLTKNRIGEILMYYLGVPDWNKDDERHARAIDSIVKGKELCLAQEDFFELAGSGGGNYVGPGYYYFHEDTDRWRCDHLLIKSERLAFGLKE